MSAKQLSFSAWYYPWASVDESSLKRALLYFDNISISHEMSFASGSSYGTQALLQHLNDQYEAKKQIDLGDGEVIENPLAKPVPQEVFDRINRLLRFRDSVAPLEKAGVLNLAPDLMPFVSFEDSERLDNVEKEFSKIISRVAPSYYGIKRDELVNNVSSCMTNDIFAQAQGMPSWFFKDSLESLKSQLSLVALYSLIRGEVPITDDDRVRRLFADIMGAKQAKEFKLQGSRSRHHASDALATTVMREFLPDFEFQTYDDVLEARDRLADELLAFRSYMIDLSTRISAEPHTAAFTKEIQRISSTTVRHAVNDLKKKVGSSRHKFFLSIAKNILTAAPFSLATIVYPSSPPLLLWAAAAGFLTAFEISKFRVDESKINDVSFILSAQKIGNS